MGFIDSLTGMKEKNETIAEFGKQCELYKANIERLTKDAKKLYSQRKKTISLIKQIQKLLSGIKHLPNVFAQDVETSLKYTDDFCKAVEYESDPKKYAELTDKTGRTAAFVAGGGAIAGAGIGLGGGTAAMSIATLMGTASTGAAISGLTGAAATNAALAWLGGGAVAAGGSGIAGGTLILGLMGPVGAIITGLSLFGCFALLKRSNRKKVEEVSKHITSIKHDNKSLSKKLAHLDDIIGRSELNFQSLEKAVKWIEDIKTTDYLQWDSSQKLELEQILNAVGNGAMLVNERI